MSGLSTPTLSHSDPPLLPPVPLLAPLDSSPPTPPHDAEVDAHTAQAASESFRDTSLPPERPSDDLPPTYDALRQAEPNNPRFARWGGWIEKRAQERRAERLAEREMGAMQRTSWSLPDDEPEDLRRDLSARWRDNEAEKRLSRESVLQVVNADMTSATMPSSSQAGRRRTESSASSASTSRSKLTRNVEMHRVGSRFGCGIPERPLCACVLPGGGLGNGDERFVLIGTQTGLYLLDNRPTSASIPLSTAASSAEAHILPLWTGLGVRHLEVYAEPAVGKDSPQGLVLGLVEEHGAPSLRMWTLASILNLGKWRNSVSLPLGSRASKSSADRHSSSLAYAKSFVGSTSPKSRKGKGLASPVQPTAHTHNDSSEPGYLFVETRATSETRADSPTMSLRSLNRLSLADSPTISQPPPLSDADRLATPLDWARSSVPLPLPAGSGEILFFQLSRSPDAAPSTDEADSPDSSDGYEDDPAASRRRRTKQEDRHRLFLFIATPKSIFLYESRPSGRRSWTLTKEYFAPSAPRFLRLIRTTGQAPPTPSASSSLASTLYSPDLALLVGLSHHSVLIRLCDSSVTELSLPPSSTTTGTRSRSSSNTSLASLSPTHRKTPSLVPLLKELKDHPVVAKVARFVEGEKGVPAGMRGADGPIPKGKRVKEEEGGLAASASLSAPSHGKWVGCEEIALDTGRRTKRRFLLLTKGTTTYLVASPLRLVSPASPNVAHPAPHLVPLHTFHWPTLGSSPSSSLTHLNAFVSTLEEDSSFSHLTLVGFSATGFSVQEHLISHAAVEAVFTSSPIAASHSSTTIRLIVPLDTLPAHAADAEDDPDLSDSATLDFGRETGWLCGTRGDRYSEELTSGTRGEYLWTRAQGEYVVKRVETKL
ncbi:hypothetical protein RTBOTA2_000682 [Rhodotorula toruloides]|uniref:BY PROTMAP: gi/647403113/emb/CDR49271.1/ RHTO0S25e00144g1_1 [Rhodosporidium toruloides] n=1 Tax=Rhodotorula toruloides TaxID=5286 RepID=A0A0K3CL89_RHOTO|nr:hypothetical protein RTBOTA2_000682 [Rhodotorula toruloides]